MNLEKLKAEAESVWRRAQELVNEQLRLEGEHRRLTSQIAELEKGSETPVSETVEEGTTNGEATQTD
jgi:predicted  nucleic acid-binding Zn-ribbon protein